MFTGKKNFASEFVLKTERPPHLYDNNNNNSKNNNNDDNNRHRCLNWNKVYTCQYTADLSSQAYAL